MNKDHDPSSEFSELRRRAEARYSDSTAQKTPSWTEADTQRLIHELQVHQIELEMQNEELQQAREEVEAGLERYTDLYDFAPVGYFTLLKDGTISKTNLNGALMLGAVRATLEGRRFGLFVANDYQPAFNEFLHRVFESQVKEVCEVALLREGSDPLWVHIEATAAIDGQECRTMVTDITERKRTETALHESEERYRRLADNAADIIFRYNLTPIPHLSYINPAVQVITGFGPEECYADPDIMLHMVHLDDNTSFFAGWMTNLVQFLNPQDEPVLMRWIGKDGAIRWMESRVVAVRDAAGQLVAVEGISRDISERKLAEEALRRSEEKFSNAFFISPDSVNINRLKDGLYLDINQGFTALSGYTAQEVIGKTSLEINIWANPEDRQRLVQGLRERGEVKNLEAPFRMKNGQIKTCLMSANIIEIKGEACILSITRDITERKQAEIQLNEQLDELRRWHAITLGRETRILELKGEVNELLAQMGQPPRYTSVQKTDARDIG